MLVPAAGHTPGSQLVYVRLADGTELLLLGDVAWHMDQLRQLHYRPRLVTDWFLGEDRGAVMAQWRTLHGWITAHPEVHLVVSHDADQRRELIASGILQDGLESVPGAPGPTGRNGVATSGPMARKGVATRCGPKAEAGGAGPGGRSPQHGAILPAGVSPGSGPPRCG